MVASHNLGIGGHKKSQTKTKEQQKKQGWNLMCDIETHEALDILGAHMLGKQNMHSEIKKSVQIPKTKIIKVVVLEKLKKLRLSPNSKEEEVVNHQ